MYIHRCEQAKVHPQEQSLRQLPPLFRQALSLTWNSSNRLGCLAEILEYLPISFPSTLGL